MKRLTIIIAILTVSVLGLKAEKTVDDAKGLSVGTTAPLFEGVDGKNNNIALSDVLEKGTTVLFKVLSGEFKENRDLSKKENSPNHFFILIIIAISEGKIKELPKKPNEAILPIIIPIKKKIFTIDLFNTPIDFNIAISLVLFLTKIVKPEIILKAATMIINDKMINITFLSTFRAENKELFISDQE